MHFSFIIPTYNRGYCIENTLQSIFNQSFTDYEIIVIDDASSDNTSEIIKRYSNLPNFKYIKLETNGGVNIARNTGIKNAKGNWIILLDSDDRLTSNGLTDIFNTIEQYQGQSKVFWFVCKNTLDGSLTTNRPTFCGLVTAKDIFNNTVQGEHLAVVKKKIFQNITFEERIRGGEGITWKQIVIDYPFYISNIPTRIYNNENTDRLSNLTKDFYRRVLRCHIEDLRIHYFNYLKFSFFSFFSLLLKIIYYKIKSI